MHGVDLQGTIVILDEAHNIVSVPIDELDSSKLILISV